MSGHPRLYQLICLLVGLGLLLGLSWPSHRALNEQRGKLIPPTEEAGKSAELDSFAMGLMLGGFRGPLVMYEWIAADNEKNNEDTERFLTRMKLISDLQPQFVTMYIHQSWNLAYNISVQYSLPSEKYRWVIEGIRFAELGNRRIPDNTDILAQIGQLYYDKLGNSQEADYFTRRFRRESLEPPDPSRRMVAIDPQTGCLLPPRSGQWLFIDRLPALIADAQAVLKSAAEESSRGGQTRVQLPLNPPPDTSARQTWKQGVSVFAVSYEYYKQANRPGLPAHTQYGDSVVSSRPAISLRSWENEEINLALDAEQRVWPGHQDGPTVGLPMPLPTAAMLAGDSAAAAYEEAIAHFKTADDVGALCIAEYESHLARYGYESSIYRPHVDIVSARRKLAQAGLARLEGIRQWLAAGGAAAGDSDALARAQGRLREAESLYDSAISGIRYYVARIYRVDAWSTDFYAPSRKEYDDLIAFATQAKAQIEAMLGQ
ncbi:MAG: hypothetical protein BIFFINMI_00532 [Phycisphaerae bacterium]|nr:hypothetical protein [Phycisphaerae bacterium]